MHSPSALEGQTAQWSNGRHTMTCGQRRTVVLSEDRCPPDRWQNQRRPRQSLIKRLPPSLPRSRLRLVPRTIVDFPLMTGVKLFSAPPTPLPAKIQHAQALRNACAINLGKCFRLLVQCLLFKHASHAPAIGFPIGGKWGTTKIPSLFLLPSLLLCYVPYLASDPLWTPRRL